MTGRTAAPVVSAWIGLGSNLDDPVEQLHRALKALREIDQTRVLRHSSFYISPPMGPKDQPDFVNAVAELETGLAADGLLDALQAIEQAQGRERHHHWGPRTLDLDLLLYGREKIITERLVVPHPGLPERDFVLYPLAELAPELEIPGLGNVNTLCRRQPGGSLRRLPDRQHDNRHRE